MGPSLRITTLGELTIELDGESVSGLASRKAEALLVYLAITGKTHAREALATMLWDDRPLGRSLGNLSVLINSLKQDLAPFLVIDRASLGISVGGGLWVDVDEINRLKLPLESGGGRTATADESDLEAVEQALGLYRGAFLLGFHLRQARGFEEWAALEQERIQRQVLEGYRWLANAHAHVGALDAAIRILSRSLEIDPLQESIHRSLMKSLALADRSGLALVQYQKCARILEEELGVEPYLETRRLYDRVLARRERTGGVLPAPASKMVGRQEELASIKCWLLEPETRLLTLVGSGGIGKTRLALEAAAGFRSHFLEGVWFVDLAPLPDPGLVAQAVGRALGIPERSGGSQPATRSEDPTSRIVDYLERKELLIVLDNCEHLLSGCATLSDRLLRSCPGLKMLATSRERFDLPLERLFEVEPLPVPAADLETEPSRDGLRTNDSIRLFEQRARAVRPGFRLTEQNARLLTRICRVLDGMPLAIELAASRLHGLSLGQLEKQLATSMTSIGRDQKTGDPRHATLEAAIAWSYTILSEEEQQLFRLATIFRQGFDRESLSQVAQRLGLDQRLVRTALPQLVGKSLVVLRHPDAAPRRYAMLEPVRQFGLVRMVEDPLHERALDAHADHFLGLAEQFGPRLHGRERKVNIERLASDAENLRAALQRHLACGRDRASLRFADALWEGYWLNQGHFQEGLDWVERILEISNQEAGFERGSLLLARGAFAWTLGRLDDAIRQVSEAMDYAQVIGDLRLLQWTHYWKAIIIYDRSEFDQAARLLERGAAFAEKAGERRGAAWCTFYQAQIARIKGSTEDAIQLYKEALEVLDELDVFGAGWCYIYLGHLATEQQEYNAARAYLTSSQDIYETLGNPRGMGGTERGFGLLELEQGNLEGAEAHLRRSRALFDQLGWIKMASSSEVYLGFIATAEGRLEEASELLVKTLAYHQREGDLSVIAQILAILALAALNAGFLPVCAALLEAAETLQAELRIAFPHHLRSAIEHARTRLQQAGGAQAAPRWTWQEYVQAILAHPRGWLQALNRTSRHA